MVPKEHPLRLRTQSITETQFSGAERLPQYLLTATPHVEDIDPKRVDV